MLDVKYPSIFVYVVEHYQNKKWTLTITTSKTKQTLHHKHHVLQKHQNDDAQLNYLYPHPIFLIMVRKWLK